MKINDMIRRTRETLQVHVTGQIWNNLDYSNGDLWIQERHGTAGTARHGSTRHGSPRLILRQSKSFEDKTVKPVRKSHDAHE